jgi:hypothetical protein
MSGEENKVVIRQYFQDALPQVRSGDLVASPTTGVSVPSSHAAGRPWPGASWGARCDRIDAQRSTQRSAT